MDELHLIRYHTEKLLILFYEQNSNLLYKNQTGKTFFGVVTQLSIFTTLHYTYMYECAFGITFLTKCRTTYVQ